MLSRFLNTRLSTAIELCPNGKYSIVGSVPMALTYQAKNSVGLPVTRVKVYDTEQEVINALLEVGCTRFQLADCTWYNA